MADEVNSGLLGAIDPQTLEQLKAFIAMMQPQQKTIDQAKNNRLIDFGLGLMGARKGSEWATIGNSGLNAMQNYNKDIAAQQAQQGQNVSQAMQMMQLANQNRTLNQNTQFGNQLLGKTSPVAPPSAISLGQSGAMPSLSPTNANADTLSAVQTASQPAGQTARQQLLDMGVPEIAIQAAAMSPNPQAAVQSLVEKFGAPTAGRPNSFMFVGGKPKYYNAPAPAGMTYVPDESSPTGTKLVQVPDAQRGYAAAAAIPDLVKRFTTPQTGVVAGGGKGIVGTEGDALFGPGGVLGALSGVVNGQQSAAPAQPQPAPAPPNSPRGRVQTDLSPEQRTDSEALGAEAGAYRSAAAQSSKAIAELGTIKQTLDYFTPGPTLPARASIAGVAQEVPGIGRYIADALVPNSKTALPAIAGMEKFAVGLTAEQSKVFGSREGQQVIGMIKSANANAGMVPGAPQLVLDAQLGVHQYIMDKAQGAEAWKAEPAHNDSLKGFSEAWDREHPVSQYVHNLPALQNIAEGKPPGAPRNDTPATGPAATPSYAIAPAARGNATVQQVLKNGTAEQKAKLAAKGYLVTQ